MIERGIGIGQKFLITGGILSLLASLLHLAVIVGGPDWYRFFGAGEGMARMAEEGSIYPATMTVGIALILAVWAHFAFAGAGLVWKPPLLKTGLIAITAIYLLRGLALLPMLAFAPRAVDSFAIWSSLIVLVYGLVYAVGIRKAWAAL
ncbi:MAG: hypothetical protein V3V15_08805 [Sphingorhabdus sp.]